VGRAIRSGDVVRYTKGSKTHGIEAGEYTRVERVNATENLLTVKRESGEEVSYDHALQGVTLYAKRSARFSQGDACNSLRRTRGTHCES